MPQRLIINNMGGQVYEGCTFHHTEFVAQKLVMTATTATEQPQPTTEPATEPATEPTAETTTEPTAPLDAPDDGFDADTCGLHRCHYARHAWHHIWQHHTEYANATYWVAVYCALLQLDLIPSNLAAYARWVQEKWGASITPTNARTLLRQKGLSLAQWDTHDPRLRPAHQAGTRLLQQVSELRDQHLRQALGR